MNILCFDVGGTFIKYSLVSDIGNIEISSMPTRKTLKDNFILEDIIKVIDEFCLKVKIDAIGIATAGVVDNKSGEVIFAGPTIPNYSNTKIKRIIEQKFKIKCFVENDVNAAAYGEYVYGNYDSTMFCITFGTGVGGAFINDGELYTGFSKTAGEIGYIPFKNGYFQEFSSADYLVKLVSEKLNKEVDGKYIFDNAKKGDKVCLNSINKFIKNMSHGLLNIIYMLNPKHIVIGGGITGAGEFLEKKIIREVNKKLISKQFQTNIKLAGLQNTAAIYGIYHIALKNIL